MYSRVRARQRKLKICLHSALYNYNTLIINHLRVYTPSTHHLHYLQSAKNRLNKVQTPTPDRNHPKENEEKR